MHHQLNLPLEFLLTGIQLITLWILFCLPCHPESKVKRIILICFMALWRPLHIIAALAFTFTLPAKIILQAAAFLILILLSEGKIKNKIITAIYLWNTGLLVDIIFACLFTGIVGELPVVNYLEMSTVQIAMLLWAIFYYLLMRAMPQEAFERVPLRFWFLALFTPFLGAAAIFAALNPLKSQLEAGFNNFLFCGVFGGVVLALNIFIFYLYIKLITSYHSQLFAGELAKTPPIYTLANGLSTAFIEKYSLSKRQIEIVEALLQGKSNKEVAVDLNIEVNTVQVHLQNIYRKTGTSGRYAIMALVGAQSK